MYILQRTLRDVLISYFTYLTIYTINIY